MLLHLMPPNFKQKYNKSFPLRLVIKLMSRVNVYNLFAIFNGCAEHSQNNDPNPRVRLKQKMIGIKITLGHAPSSVFSFCLLY